MEFKYEDGWKVLTRPNPPYGTTVGIFNPKGKMVTRRTYEPDKEEHWIAELMYVEFAKGSGA